MSEQYDILIKQARLRSQPDDLMDIGISGGVIKKIGKGISGSGDTEIKARGNLVTASCDAIFGLGQSRPNYYGGR